MNAAESSFELTQSVRRHDGFEVYTLSNASVEIAVAPELGAKIVSLKNAKTGREWLWRPGENLKLFRNRAGDDFSASPLTGLDECLPTIAPCSWQGRELPDHGEVWNAAWSVDEKVWKHGALRTSARLPISPFDFERTIELRGNEVRLSYRLHNRGAAQERFLWAMHPLLRLRACDRLLMPPSTRALCNGEAWVDAVDTAVPNGKCSKLFVWPVSQGEASICNTTSGDRLDLAWSPAENRALGLWLTRGGWHGHHHFALEPANGDADALSEAAARNRCGAIAANDSAAWRVSFRVGP